MKSTGIVRSLDSVGRVVLPMEIRKEFDEILDTIDQNLRAAYDYIEELEAQIKELKIQINEWKDEIMQLQETQGED